MAMARTVGKFARVNSVAKKPLTYKYEEYNKKYKIPVILFSL